MTSSRAAANERVAQLVQSWPDLPFGDRSEKGLVGAIVQEVIRRWRSVEWMVGTALARDPESIEPVLRGALLVGAAQLLFMNEPDHAVVDDAVEWTKQKLRPGAGRMANGVLRTIARWRLEQGPVPERWWEKRNLLLLSGGQALRLDGELLPESQIQRLAVGTSHADVLIERWIGQYGIERASQIARHSLVIPPRVVADPTGVLRDSAQVIPHSHSGFVVWNDTLEALRAAIDGNPSLRVQDAGSAGPVARTASLAPRLIVDACAGRGTKTRQLAELHPHAEIVAGDTDTVRARALRASFSGHPRVRIMSSAEILALRGVDLLVLDVPCSNSGVLARRPEAKSRFDLRRLLSLIEIQRRIVSDYRPILAPNGRVLYSTCSLEVEENEGQCAWIGGALGRTGELEVHLPLGAPGDDPAQYADGGASVLF